MDHCDADLIASVVDRLEDKYCVFGNLAALARLSDSVSQHSAPGYDAAGGVVNCLTSATMGITAGLFKVAEAISDLSHSVSQLKNNSDS